MFPPDVYDLPPGPYSHSFSLRISHDLKLQARKTTLPIGAEKESSKDYWVAQYLQEGQNIRHGGWTARKPVLTALGAVNGETPQPLPPHQGHSVCLSDGTGKCASATSPIKLRSHAGSSSPILSPSPGLSWGICQLLVFLDHTNIDFRENWNLCNVTLPIQEQGVFKFIQVLFYVLPQNLTYFSYRLGTFCV